ncbi:unnamed protein product, partial [Closterium sp. NIES-54]
VLCSNFFVLVLAFFLPFNLGRLYIALFSFLFLSPASTISLVPIYSLLLGPPTLPLPTPPPFSTLSCIPPIYPTYLNSSEPFAHWGFCPISSRPAILDELPVCGYEKGGWTQGVFSGEHGHEGDYKGVYRCAREGEHECAWKSNLPPPVPRASKSVLKLHGRRGKRRGERKGKRLGEGQWNQSGLTAEVEGGRGSGAVGKHGMVYGGESSSSGSIPPSSNYSVTSGNSTNSSSTATNPATTTATTTATSSSSTTTALLAHLLQITTAHLSSLSHQLVLAAALYSQWCCTLLGLRWAEAGHGLAAGNLVSLLVGYEVVAFCCALHVLVAIQLRRARGLPLVGALPATLLALLQVAPAIQEHLVAAVRHGLVVLKVTSLLSVELGAFPFLCGWWIDFCSLSLFGASPSDRLALLLAHPLLCCFLHWFVGILYMLQVSLLVTILREILRPGVLSFLRDPTDPNFNPFRDLVEDPIPKHARRIVLSLFAYGALVVLLLFLPVRAAIAVAPSMFPFNYRFSDPLMEIPLDMLLFHVCIPFAIDRLRPRATIKAALSLWFRAAARLLMLQQFLLPPPPAPAAAAGVAAAGAGAAVAAPPPPPPAGAA